MLTRREFVMGGAAVLGATAVGGATWKTFDAGVLGGSDGSAQRDLWNRTKGLDRIALAGALAANSHNAQPWLFKVGGDGMDLFGDASRTLGLADPRLRELHVSLGCALENMVVAAAESGSPTRVEYPTGRPVANHFAHLALGAGGSPVAGGGLASAIPLRHTNRGPFDTTRPVPVADLAALGALATGQGLRVRWITDPAARARFTELTVQATELQVADAAMQRDSQRWYRMTRASADAHRDGVTIDSANLGPVATTFLKFVPPTPAAFDAGWAQATRETHCATASAFGLIVVAGEGDKRAWVDAGRAYERMQLAAVARGIAFHPVSQSLTIRDRELAAGAPGPYTQALRTAGGGGEVVLAFRVGHPVREQSPSARRALVVKGA